MMHNLRLFSLFSRFALRTTLQGRMGVGFFMAGKILRFVFVFLLVSLIFTKTRALKGYSFEQAAIFFLTYNIIDTMSQILFREVYRFRYMVVSGSFDMVLLKPYHPFIRILIGGVDFMDLILLIPYLAILFVMAGRIGALTLPHILLFIMLLTSSIVMVTAFHIGVLASAIITTEVDHTIMIYRDITSIARMPMEIYKEPVRSLFTYVIPVGIMMATPAKALLGILSAPVILLSLCFSGMILMLSLGAWKKALRAYQSWGG